MTKKSANSVNSATLIRPEKRVVLRVDNNSALTSAGDRRAEGSRDAYATPSPAEEHAEPIHKRWGVEWSEVNVDQPQRQRRRPRRRRRGEEARSGGIGYGVISLLQSLCLTAFFVSFLFFSLICLFCCFVCSIPIWHCDFDRTVAMKRLNSTVNTTQKRRETTKEDTQRMGQGQGQGRGEKRFVCVWCMFHRVY